MSCSTQTCANCGWSSLEDHLDYLLDGEAALYYCNWPSEFLPWSLRYGNRERMAVYSNEPPEKEPCSQWIPKKENTDVSKEKSS